MPLLYEQDQNNRYVILEVQWIYNDCWYEREGLHYSSRIFDSPDEAEDRCRELNYQFGIERLHELNSGINYGPEFSYNKNFAKNENGRWKIVETDNKDQQRYAGKVLQELGLNGYEVVQIPIEILKDVK